MKTLNHQDFERAAVAAHARGDDWSTFWTCHGGGVVKAIRGGRVCAGLIHRLMAPVVTGDLDGTTGELVLIGHEHLQENR